MVDNAQHAFDMLVRQALQASGVTEEDVPRTADGEILLASLNDAELIISIGLDTSGARVVFRAIIGVTSKPPTYEEVRAICEANAVYSEFGAPTLALMPGSNEIMAARSVPFRNGSGVAMPVANFLRAIGQFSTSIEQLKADYKATSFEFTREENPRPFEQDYMHIKG